MLQFLISQRWPTHHGLIAVEPFLVHNVFSSQRSQAVISSKKICHNVLRLVMQRTDLLIGVIVVRSNHSFVPAVTRVPLPSEQLSPHSVVCEYSLLCTFMKPF